MMMAQRAIAVLLVSFLGLVHGVDRTVSPGSNGRVIVDAVVNRIRSNCIFGDDRLFLRRLAHVESSDGEDPKTYRTGYHGGIWQIDENVFNATKTCSYSIRSTCHAINSTFGIDWRKVTWSELRKPLFSALAASLFIKLNAANPPANVAQQASFWKQRMRTDGDMELFTSRASSLPGTDCRTELDLAFILDGSGSVSVTDFRLMLGFVQKVIDKLDVGEDDVMVAAVEFSNMVGTIIPFKDFTTKLQLRNAIGTIRKTNRGTNTAHAINTTSSLVFNSTAGARPNAKRVAILVTDGRSNDKESTVWAAESAKAEGIVMISVGVGNIDRDELRAVASDPNCTHVFILRNFVEIDSLLYQLKETSCAAPKVIAIADANSTETTVTKPLPANRTVTETYETKPPKQHRGGGGSGNGGSSGGRGGDGDGGTTTDSEVDEVTEMQTVVRSEVQCGSLEIYASYLTSRPGPAFYDYRDSARDGRPSVLYLNSTVQGRSLYITIFGTRLRFSDVVSCLNPSYNVSVKTQPKAARVVCMTGDMESECTPEDFKSSAYRDLMCDDSQRDLDNPCTTGRISMHPHPSDLTKFIRCGARGKMYVTKCPEPETYNSDTQNCGHEALSGDDSTQLPDHLTNPCASAPFYLPWGRVYFAHPEERSQFVQCDVWGGAWVKQCPSGLEWSHSKTTCIRPRVLNSRCANSPAGSRFAHSNNPRKFIICSNGTEVVQMCPGTLVYVPSIGVCNWP